jgi:hypothetical protein
MDSISNLNNIIVICLEVTSMQFQILFYTITLLW